MAVKAIACACVRVRLRSFLGGLTVATAVGLPQAWAQAPLGAAPAVVAPAPETGETWREKTEVATEPAIESWSGAEAYRRTLSLYSGATYAPFGNLRQDGLRLRAVGGEDTYSYSGFRQVGTTITPGALANVYATFEGRGTFLDLLVGWQFSTASMTIKAFVGYDRTSNATAPLDPNLRLQALAYGAKAAVETWHNWAPRIWTSLDLSWTKANDAATAVMRTGVRTGTDTFPSFSVGPELAITSNTEGLLERVGLFVRYETLEGEVTVSGGASRTVSVGVLGGLDSGAPGAYVTAQVLSRF
jgi:cellulose biosynthesis protein BcsS